MATGRLAIFLSTAAVVVTLLLHPSFGATVNCNRNRACYPWDIGSGPYCGRGNRISLRFTTDIAEENWYTRYNTTPPMKSQTVSYGFCPVVDELQAFNLSAAPLLGALVVPGLNVSNSSTYLNPNPDVLNFSTRVKEGYVTVYGFGSVDNVNEPVVNVSTGAAMIISNDTLLCPDGVLLSTFLVLSITLEKGKFKYTTDRANPVGSQFQSTCAEGRCVMDSSQACIGNEVISNCAKCYKDPILLANATVQIWVSYYGTDINSRTLMSGSNNPLNFQKFSSSGVWNNLQSSVDNLQSGQVINDDQLGPQT